jgi:hypothetical protein
MVLFACRFLFLTLFWGREERERGFSARFNGKIGIPPSLLFIIKIKLVLLLIFVSA